MLSLYITGQFLASAGDDYNILVFRLNGQRLTRSGQPSGATDWADWSTHRLLRGHVLDVCDLCWSPDSTQLISGSVDNVMFKWNLDKGKTFSKRTTELVSDS